MPLHGRIIQDGSDLVNASLKWTVTVCCLEEEDLIGMTSSVRVVLGLSAEDIQINSFSSQGDSMWVIQYFIKIENTKTFETYLLKNIKNQEFLQKIKTRIEEDSNKVTVSTFDYVSIAEYTGTVDISSW